MRYPKGNQFKDHADDGFDDEPCYDPAPVKRRPTMDAKKQADNLKAFEAGWPDVAAWWTNSDFPFAANMKRAVMEWGELTGGQMNAVLKCVDKAKAFKEAQAVRVAAAPTVDLSGVTAAFARGLRVLYLSAANRDFKLTAAKAYSKNPGALYVAEADLYLGKIVNNKFVRSNECTDDDAADVYLALETPLANAVNYGKRTGKCSCCGRLLENEESVSLGIGPICRGKYFG